ncbi:MAG: pyridoxamine kinase [Clostridium sp.]|nr:pyridoxamine kinase [Clostridium sp.]
MKKCAIINDLSGFGKCSLTASIPILSAMGAEAHPLPTAVLSNQTAYDSYKAVALTEVMPQFIKEWRKLGVRFDAILTGFVMDNQQLDIISGFIDEFSTKDNVVIVDPVMADNGRLYDGYTDEMCSKIKNLCYKADIITPNIAELAFLADEEYSEDLNKIISYGNKLISKGIKSIVATGYKDNGKISNIVFDGKEVNLATAAEHGGYYSGTGDILAAIITGGVLRGMDLYSAAKLATQFIEKAILSSDVTNHNDGIEFERFLGDLI